MSQPYLLLTFPCYRYLSALAGVSSGYLSVAVPPWGKLSSSTVMCCSIISDLVLIMRTLNVASSWCNVFVSSSNVAATFCRQSVFWCMSWRELCWGISRVHCSSCFYCGAYSGHSARWRSWRRRSRGWRRSWSASRPRRLRPTKRAPASRRWPRKLARCGSRSGHFHWSLKVNWEQQKQTAPAACQKPVNRCSSGYGLIARVNRSISVVCKLIESNPSKQHQQPVRSQSVGVS